MDLPQPVPIRVFVVDDQTIIRAGLRMLLENQPELEVVGDAGTRDEARVGMVQEQPHVALLEVEFHDDDGLEVLSTMVDAAPQTRVILLTCAHDVELHSQAVQRGAVGVVLKQQSLDEVLQAIRKVHQGEAWLNGALMARLLRPALVEIEPPAGAPLNERERTIVALLCEGLQNKQIAQRLHISDVTVRHQLTRIYDKLGVNSRLELAMFAIHHELCGDSWLSR